MSSEVYVMLLIALMGGMLFYLIMIALIEYQNEKEKKRAIEISDDEFDKSMNCGGLPVGLPCNDKTCAHYNLCKAITG